MMLLTTQQMAEMREHAADREEEREERRMRMEEQHEDRRMQIQIQQQLMATITMLVMMSGRVGAPVPPLPMIPPRDKNDGTGLNNTGGEGKTPE